MFASSRSLNQNKKLPGIAVGTRLLASLLLCTSAAATQAAADNWTILSGDWNGDGITTPGLYNSITSTFFLRSKNATDGFDTIVRFGRSGWLPVVGDWNGDGTDTIGVYNPRNNRFFLREINSRGTHDRTFRFPGRPGVPISGDWDGDGADTVGLYHPNTAIADLGHSLSDGTTSSRTRYGQLGWRPLVADWDGDGIDTLAVYNPVTQRVFLRNSNAVGTRTEKFIRLKTPGTAPYPFVGKWADAADGPGFGVFDRKTHLVSLIKQTGEQSKTKPFKLLPRTVPIRASEYQNPAIPNAGSGGRLELEAESFHASLPVRQHRWAKVAAKGASAGVAIKALPNEEKNFGDNYLTESARIEFEANFPTSGRFYVWVRGQASSNKDDSLHVSLDGRKSDDAFDLSGFQSDWTWSSRRMDGVRARVTVETAGPHLLSVWIREDGVMIDQIVLTQDVDFKPSGPVNPDPVQPDPVQPDPVQPDPVQPDPVQPDPVQPVPTPQPPVDHQPVAKADAAVVEAGAQIDVPVLKNDSGLADGPVFVSIVQPPSKGTAQVRSGGTIRYTAQAGFEGTISLTYRVTDADGDTAIASVSVKVECPSCGGSKPLRLQWRPNPEVVDGYRVYFGPSSATAILELSDLNIQRGDIEAKAPLVDYNVEKDLGLSTGQKGCFRVRAYRDSRTSGYSGSVCTTI